MAAHIAINNITNKNSHNVNADWHIKIIQPPAKNNNTIILNILYAKNTVGTTVFWQKYAIALSFN